MEFISSVFRKMSLSSLRAASRSFINGIFHSSPLGMGFMFILSSTTSLNLWTPASLQMLAMFLPYTERGSLPWILCSSLMLGFSLLLRLRLNLMNLLMIVLLMCSQLDTSGSMNLCVARGKLYVVYLFSSSHRATPCLIAIYVYNTWREHITAFVTSVLSVPNNDPLSWTYCTRPYENKMRLLLKFSSRLSYSKILSSSGTNGQFPMQKK